MCNEVSCIYYHKLKAAVSIVVVAVVVVVVVFFFKYSFFLKSGSLKFWTLKWIVLKRGYT